MYKRSGQAEKNPPTGEVRGQIIKRSNQTQANIKAMTTNQLKAINHKANAVKWWAKTALKAKEREEYTSRYGFKEEMFGTIFTESESEFNKRQEKYKAVRKYAEFRVERAIETLVNQTN
jgi:hypothetical protein